MIGQPSVAQMDRASSTRIWLCLAPTDNQCQKLALFLTDGSVPIHDDGDQDGRPNQAEQQK